MLHEWPIPRSLGLPTVRRVTIALVSCASVMACNSGEECPLGRDPDGYCNPTRICRGQVILANVNDAQHCGEGDQCVVCPVPGPGIANAVADCVNFGTGACGFHCVGFFGDCNGNTADGCETALGPDPNNCGACGVRCAHECVDGGCVLRWEGERNVSGLTDGRLSIARRTIWTSWDGGTLDLREGPGDGGDALTLASVPAGSGVPATTAQGESEIYFATGSAGIRRRVPIGRRWWRSPRTVGIQSGRPRRPTAPHRADGAGWCVARCHRGLAPAKVATGGLTRACNRMRASRSRATFPTSSWRSLQDCAGDGS